MSEIRITVEKTYSGYTDEHLDAWMHLPLTSKVITAPEFGAWLERRDERRDLKRLSQKNNDNQKCKLIISHHMEACENCGSVMPMMNEYYRAKLRGCPYCLSEFTNAGTTYLSEVDDE